MKEYKIEVIESTLRALGHKHFKYGSYNLNLIAIRADNSISDRFDDLFILDFKDELGARHVFYMKCTTDPGKHWLLNPMNVKGCIITCPGQYREAFEIGTHRGYEALRQCGDMEYVRDNNLDNILDFKLMKDPKNRFWGKFFTNIHRASKNWLLRLIGKYSAGCCVLQDIEEFEDILMYYCKKQVAAGKGRKFTYTLIEEKEVKRHDHFKFVA